VKIEIVLEENNEFEAVILDENSSLRRRILCILSSVDMEKW